MFFLLHKHLTAPRTDLTWKKPVITTTLTIHSIAAFQTRRHLTVLQSFSQFSIFMHFHHLLCSSQKSSVSKNLWKFGSSSKNFVQFIPESSMHRNISFVYSNSIAFKNHFGIPTIFVCLPHSPEACGVENQFSFSGGRRLFRKCDF
ncbi:hypothetical protein IEQ34_010534 [Dendrobium chrysotoxum]|uniref:Uncharacterized protein n=1 Tax=Dendrobium chrysotoxum TaxID=161865 RepID=A0AAV7GT23_DENCH|nr:hypothetical protein IEQ34_010534 [Dendrobium chrysotoxum]